MDEQDEVTAAGVAAAALLLEPGYSHWYRMPDDRGYAEACVRLVERALEDQARFGRSIIPNLAPLDELWVDLIEIGNSLSLVVQRDGDFDDDPCAGCV